ncbi:MAG: tetratricopeptide repeat protein [Planctomycetota bacterium]|nr:tetratricopeptide repeat protein [Planctomycetota bacterium]
MSCPSDLPPAARRPRPWGTVAAVAILLVAGAAAYSNSFHGPFIFDDLLLIPNNPDFPRDGSPWQLAFSPVFRTRPVIALTVAMNYAIGGFNVVGYHVVNLIIHLLAALVLFGVVRRTLRLPALAGRFADASTGLALAIALLWMLHPLQTQSVTYIIQRCESLMGLFYLLALYAVIRGATSQRQRGWYGAAILSCALSMGCKQVAVTIPLVVLIYDRVFLAAGWKELLRRRWWLYGGLLASWLLVWPGPAWAKQPILEAPPWWQYALTQPGVLLRYLELAVWPGGLCIDYSWPVAETVGAILPQALAVGGLLALSLWALVRRPAWGAVAMAFWLILAPTSSVLPLPDLAFEHRMYLPLAALIVLAVMGAYIGLARLTKHRGAAAVAVVLLASALAARTYVRNDDYRTTFSIWKSALAACPTNARALLNVGAELAARHERSGAAADLDEAIRCYQESLRIRPDNAEAHCNLAIALVARGEMDEAIRHYQEALRLKPDYADAYCNLGLALYKQGQPDEALRCYQEALRIKPDLVEAYSNIATVLLDQGKTDEAIRYCQEALRIRPDFAEAHHNLGMALYKQGRADEAIRECQEALRLRPDYAEAHSNLASILVGRGRLDEAIQHCREALRTRPDYASAHNNMARALAAQGKTDEAIAHYRQALRVNPDLVQALRNLAWILATDPDSARRSGPEAVRLAEHGCRLTARKDPALLDTLAAAYAEAGQMKEAAAAAREAEALAWSQSKRALSAQIQSRLQLYEAGQPYRAERKP